MSGCRLSIAFWRIVSSWGYTSAKFCFICWISTCCLLLAFSLIVKDFFKSASLPLTVTGPFRPVIWLLSFDLVRDFLIGFWLDLWALSTETSFYGTSLYSVSSSLSLLSKLLIFLWALNSESLQMSFGVKLTLSFNSACIYSDIRSTSP